MTAVTPAEGSDELRQPSADAVKAAKPRVALWDNARFVLIVLVVAGHAISTIRTEGPLGFGIYTYVYLFHMPAMIVLSGAFSKPEVTPKAIRSTVQLIAIWALWEGMWAALRFFVEGKELSSGFLVAPGWTLWFLVTLATMRIVLPYIAKLRHPLVFSIVVALAAGLSPAIGNDFSASRTLCFLPFFVAGWMARDRGWLSGEWFTRPGRAARGWAWGLLGVVALAFVAVPQLQQVWRLDRWLRWRDGYAVQFAEAPIGSFEPSTGLALIGSGIAVRLLLLVVAAAMTLALLVIVPRRTSRMTAWGSRTLYVYLLHGPIIWIARESGFIGWLGELGGPEMYSVPGVLIVFVAGAALAVVLSAEWVTRVFRPVIEPKLDRVFARD